MPSLPGDATRFLLNLTVKYNRTGTAATTDCVGTGVENWVGTAGMIAEKDGNTLGEVVGVFDNLEGALLGSVLGTLLGILLGEALGILLGEIEGDFEGAKDGFSDTLGFALTEGLVEGFADTLGFALTEGA